MTHFWAKTTSDDKPGISVYDHMVNVGSVACCLAEIRPGILEYFQITLKEVGALASLHDLGKISPGFQRKCEAWLRESGLSKVAANACWDTGMESDHCAVTHSSVQDFLIQAGSSRNQAQYLSAVLAAHHGRIRFPPTARGIRPPQIKQITENDSGIEWNNERKKTAQDVCRHFGADRLGTGIDEQSPALWWLAGLTSVADWIGSDERFFPPGQGSDHQDPSILGRKALEAIGFRRIQFVAGLSFHDLFHDPEKPEIKWVPNEMQEKTVTTVTGPGVYVIEAPMGMGKTEAALWAGYRLLLSGKANGIYFALPTQMTSNRIHIRMNDFLRRILAEPSTSRLIHSNSWLVQADCPLHPVATDRRETAQDDARTGRDWFASTKRAMLAPFGVGTVDQALLGVVAAKHFFVRHFALAGKVVVIDEVHSYDVYTGTLIDKLIAALEGLGCTVIVLSATLTGKRREQVVSCPLDVHGATLPYPLITGRVDGASLKPVAAMSLKPRDVKMDFINPVKAQEAAISLARKGGAALWIYDTVDGAQKQYQQLRELCGQEFPIGLLHSRFPFWRREQLETEWMERLGKHRKTLCGCILVSTQVAEQSVDLDADLLITELAPTDMLLQRLGRLWRHERQKRPVECAWVYILEEKKSLEDLRIMKPEEIKRALGDKANVYAPFVLLRSLEVWREQCKRFGAVMIPPQIREFIELTYQEKETEPDSWRELCHEWAAAKLANKSFALRNTNIWQVALEDEEGVQTRINEVPTVALVLCKGLNARKALFIDQSEGLLDKEVYRLASAQAIYRNLVKIPKYFFDKIEAYAPFSDYLHGEQSIGIVTESGAVNVKGLKKGTKFFYSDDLGLVIQKTST
ncbi:MAG TPA: CRISPR-associated helicase Cas3' [Syntrophobacteraceae bacterium]|nr:CRISPR-associated helicase Cas3' [Syntrophobacteraceae bacterium]